MSRPGKLGKTQRRILLAAELYHREHGQGPLWREVREPLELTRAGFAARMRALREHGLVDFTEEPRSLRVTPVGLEAAVNGRARGR